MSQRAYIGLGSNLGDRLAQIHEAVAQLCKAPEVTVDLVSNVYETDPVGPVEQGNFLNAAVCVSTHLEPEELLEVCLRIESEMGRERSQRWGPRCIDIDLLLCGAHEVSTERLTVPHPEIANRAFVLVPLLEIAPQLVLPDGRAVAGMLQQLQEQGDAHGVRIHTDPPASP